MGNLVKHVSIGLLVMIGLLIGTLPSYASDHPQQTQNTRKVTIIITGHYTGPLADTGLGWKNVVCKSAKIQVIETGSTAPATRLKLVKDSNGEGRLCQATFENMVVLSDTTNTVSGWMEIKPDNDSPDTPTIRRSFTTHMPKLSPLWWYDLGSFEIK